MRHIQEVRKLFVRTSAKSFGNICHDRNAGSLDLVSQTKILCKQSVFRKGINHLRDLARFLPSLNIFNSSEGGHADFRLQTSDHRLFSCVLDGFDNMLVASATTEIALKPVTYFLSRRVRIAIDELRSRHDHAG